VTILLAQTWGRDMVDSLSTRSLRGNRHVPLCHIAHVTAA
jgi:hypothetical protein